MMYSYVVSKTLNLPLRSWGTKARLAAGEPCEGDKTCTHQIPRPARVLGHSTLLREEGWVRLLAPALQHADDGQLQGAKKGMWAIGSLGAQEACCLDHLSQSWRPIRSLTPLPGSHTSGLQAGNQGFPISVSHSVPATKVTP